MEKLDTKVHYEKRLDIALSLHPKVLSRQQAQTIIEQNLVFTSHSKKLENDYKVKKNEQIFFKIPSVKPSKIVPIQHPLEIQYEDEYLLVVYKPAGLIVHPADSHHEDSLLHYLLSHCKLSNIGLPHRQGILHRIDKNTSGLLVVAKENTTHLALAEQFQEHKVYRKYFCFVFNALASQSYGTINKNIARHPQKRKIFSVQEKGKRAVTHWKILQVWGSIALLECILETGRTHQIRVHLQFAKMPIIGDDTYKGKKISNRNKLMQKKIANFPRQALHAGELGFFHPKKKEKILFKYPLPTDMQELLNQLSRIKFF